MNIRNTIKPDVIQTLNALKNLPEIEPDPLVFTKVIAELESDNKGNNNFNKQFGLMLILTCFLVINSVAIYLNVNDQEGLEVRNELEMQIAEEYYINYKTQ